MGEYRLSIYVKKQIGFTIGIDYGQLVIRIPFFTIHLSFRKYAKGFRFTVS